MFQGDISRAALPPHHDTPSHQSFNPVFRALPAQYGQLELGGSSSSWQLQGLTANARTTAQEMTALAWSQSASSSSQEVPAAPTAQTADDRLDWFEELPGEHEAVLSAQLLADDRQDSAEWVSSSSSSEGVVPPLRSLSFPNAALVGAFRREEEVGRFKALGRDTSLPVSVQSGMLPAGLWSSGRPQLPGPTLRQRFMQEQQQLGGPQADPPVGQEGPEPVDIWAALERQPSPIITLRQRYAVAEQQHLQQDIQGQGSSMQQGIQGQGSSMQPPQAVLELAPEDIILQEPSLDEAQAACVQTVPAQEPGSSEQHQQSGLQPQVDGVSARAVARRMSVPRRQAAAKRLSELKKLSTAELAAPREVVSEPDARVPPHQLNNLSTTVFSEPAAGSEESGNKGVHFGSAEADEKEQGSWQQARTLTRAKSSLKQARSPQNSLRRRSFRSSVSFAPISTESDSSSDGGVGGKSKGPISAAAFTAAPLLKTMSSVWASITGTSSGGTRSAAAAASTAVAGYAPTRVESRSFGDPPILKPPRPPTIASPSRQQWQAASKQAAAAVAVDSKVGMPLKAGPSKWQAATRKATAAVIAPSMPNTPTKRPMSRFGSFFDVVTEATAVHGKASLSRRLGQEHVEMGVRMLLETRTLARAESQKGAPPQQDSSLQTHPSLAKVMQVLSAKHMSKSVSLASTVQVRAVTKHCLNNPGCEHLMGLVSPEHLSHQ